MASTDRPKLLAITAQALTHVCVKLDWPKETVNELRPVDDLAKVTMIIEGHVLNDLHFIKEDEDEMVSDTCLLFTWNGEAYLIDKAALLLHRASFTAPYMVVGSILARGTANKLLPMTMSGVSVTLWCFLAFRTYPIGVPNFEVGRVGDAPLNGAHAAARAARVPGSKRPKPEPSPSLAISAMDEACQAMTSEAYPMSNGSCEQEDTETESSAPHDRTRDRTQTRYLDQPQPQPQADRPPAYSFQDELEPADMCGPRPIPVHADGASRRAEPHTPPAALPSDAAPKRRREQPDTAVAERAARSAVPRSALAASTSEAQPSLALRSSSRRAQSNHAEWGSDSMWVSCKEVVAEDERAWKGAMSLGSGNVRLGSDSMQIDLSQHGAQRLLLEFRTMKLESEESDLLITLENTIEISSPQSSTPLSQVKLLRLTMESQDSVEAVMGMQNMCMQTQHDGSQ